MKTSYPSRPRNCKYFLVVSLRNLSNPLFHHSYITARPSKPTDVSKAILEGSYGKPPPFLTFSTSDFTFPYTFKLTEKDLTTEGTQIKIYDKMPITVSARYDTDGIASTRGENDLVGRSESFINSDTSIKLQSRGIGGRFVTGLKKK